ncbi:hypothetical protein MTQ01_05515 [Streptomyces sp. XM4193]|uniref:hypothetical protein n=1 Tax=Streptomyces sp. XM4193 TaxID=2929782 RepID=UPI001FF9F865|nr:hypothetical protein [Streptomyces sp. XM4193]MCK1795474.1 hypothetical protein [Streptomyces sp. XM4193]
MPSHFDALIEELPDEDLAGDLQHALDMYVVGSKPRCEEAEYLTLLHEAKDGMADEEELPSS